MNAAESGIRQKKRQPQKRRSTSFKPGNEYAAKPGEVRNPEGRNGATKLSAGYTKILAMQPPEAMRAKMAAQLGYEPQTWAELIAMSQLLEGAKGEVQAAREIRQATEGDTLKAEHTGKDGGPIAVEYVDDDREAILRELERRGITVAFAAHTPDA